jgi:hypothetical protein
VSSVTCHVGFCNDTAIFIEQWVISNLQSLISLYHDAVKSQGRQFSRLTLSALLICLKDRGIIGLALTCGEKDNADL